VTLRRARACAAAAALAVAVAGCSSSAKNSSPAPAPTSTTIAPATSASVVVRGNGTLDGAPFDSRWVGAVVLNEGLATPCQSTLLPVTKGRYEVTVLADDQSRGCGAPGARIVPWIYAHDKYIYSANSVAWPANGTASFAPRYDSANPTGAAPSLAQFVGAVYGADGVPVSAGTRVEAFVGTTRCGVASVRNTIDFNGYVLAVVGPESIPGCTRGAPLAFRVNGQAARHARVVNTTPGRREALDLRVP
jgi:hypothetical protein